MDNTLWARLLIYLFYYQECCELKAGKNPKCHFTGYWKTNSNKRKLYFNNTDQDFIYWLKHYTTLDWQNCTEVTNSTTWKHSLINSYRQSHLRYPGYERFSLGTLSWDVGDGRRPTDRQAGQKRRVIWDRWERKKSLWHPGCTWRCHPQTQLRIVHLVEYINFGSIYCSVAFINSVMTIKLNTSVTQLAHFQQYWLFC